MYEFMLAIHIIAIALCFYSVYVLVARKNTDKAGFMVVVTVLSTLSIIGYMLEITSTELSAMLVAVKIQYIGKAFLGTFLLLTFRRYYKWNLSNILMWIYWIVDVVMLIIILTCDQHTLYYSSINMVVHENHAYIKLGKSPLYIAFMCYMLWQIVQFGWWCYKQHKKETGRASTVALSLCIASYATLIAIACSLVINRTHYDFVPVTITALTFMIAMLIKKYGLFNTMDMAKDDLIQNLNEGVIVRDAAGNVTYANPMAYEMFPEMNVIEQNELRPIIDDILKAENGEVYLNNRYYQVQARKLYEGKALAGQLITFFDVTRLHDDTKKMEKLRDEADMANKAKSNFLANMSHEIRTPINAVLGMDEMILRESEDGSILEYANNIKLAGETLLALVNDVLDLSKIESGKMNLVNVEYRVADMIKSMVSTMSFKMSEKGLSFVTEIDSSMPSILYGDEMRIRQVIMNLLSNACKYTREGQVKLIVGGEKQNDKFMLKVAVADTGIGIKEEDMSRLFDSFARMDEQANRQIEGTGLGLNITSNLLNMMGSKLDVESDYGLGSTFSFVVEQQIISEAPLGDINKINERQVDDYKAQSSFKAPDAKVLVVDDNAINLAVMKGLLKKTEMKVETALSGMDCLQMIKETKYDLIFMDHLMPEMDGIETLRKMRSHTLHRNPDTPVIVLTANAVSGAEEMYMGHGFSHYLTKPVDVKKLEAAIVQFLPEELVVYEKN